MSNTISYDARPDIPDMHMSNGLTAVFFSVLALAASALATDDHERGIAAWFAARDQSIFGLGIVGFDVSELPWSRERLEADRAFMVRAVDAAQARTGWERLDYQPREDWLFASLDQFRGMIAAFDAAHIAAPDTLWLGARPERFAQCVLHRTYLHAYGCIVCNDR